ncbi:Ras-related protein Rab [Acrasis kona]|uniref:Ras-related protein Rab n=1 Tax=Acrasis kona TaxID=1008807 RepID=A0AAW2ZHV7_9EUKA
MADGDERAVDALFKILLIGDMGVGKSCLLLRYAENTFSNSHVSTIGVDFRIRTVTIGERIVKLQIWDTAGTFNSKLFRTITQSYYKGAHGVIMVYDITQKKSFENLESWLTDIKEFADKNVGIILAGNKNDLEELRQVTIEEGQAFSSKLGTSFLETSAKNASNVEEAFQSMVEKIFEKTFENQLDSKTAAPSESQVSIVEKGKGKKIKKKACMIL